MPTERVQRRIERLLDEAEQAMDQRDWERARALARDVLDLELDNADALTFLAALERKLGEPSAFPLSTVLHPRPAAAESPLPPAFAAGRYQVKRFLGEGGKKRVYLAHDTTLDRDVAFALIKTEGLDQTARERIAREAQAMGRLGAHPRIVTVFDLGVEGTGDREQGTGPTPPQSSVLSTQSSLGQPYMVTELMAGGDVEGAIEQATEHKLPLPQSLAIAEQVCQGLEFAHGKGIVHRDLKPGNDWLTEGIGNRGQGTVGSSPLPGGEGQGEGETRAGGLAQGLGTAVAKLGDFGLAVALDRSRLTQAGMMVGTVAYMPPEQALGGDVTPRSDLYSLGAMLYEMVTGRPPFLGQDSVAIIGQHLNTAPAAPSWHNPDCPRPLEALILRLLAKDPAERPASAADVLAALQAIDLSIGSKSNEGQVAADLLDSLAGGVFVGRRRELGELKAALEDALSGHGRLLALVGEPGIGKTRTSHELTTYAALRQCQVLWGRCYEGAGAPPYWPWVQLIRAYVRERDADCLRSEMGVGAADIAEVVSDLRERLPGLQSSPQLEPEQARFRLIDSITTFLCAASLSQPLVLVLEDLHWADRPSLLLLEFLARELAGSRLMVMMTYRDAEVSRQHPLSLTLGELNRERLFQRIVLRGLSHDDVSRFIELTTGAGPPPGLTEAVFSQTEGNPLFVTEVVRLLVQEGALSASSSLPSPSVGRGAGGEDGGEGEAQAAARAQAPPAGPSRQSWTVRISEGVREVIGRRLSRLSERCNQTLTLSAVIGRQFSLDQLVSLSADISRDRLIEVIEEALAAGVVEELPQAVGQYQFTHALVQETLVGELSLTRRVQVHAQIAESLEKLYGAQAEQHAAELAYHYGHAVALLGPAKLVQYSLLAGERALAAYAYEEAQEHFQRGLEAKSGAPDDLNTAALLWGLGRSQAALVDLRTAVRTIRRAFDVYLANEHVPGAVAVAQYPWPAVPGSLKGVAELMEQALPLVSEQSLDAARMLISYATALYLSRVDYDAAQRAFTRAEALARSRSDRSLEVRILAAAAGVDLYHTSFAEGAERAVRALELARQEGDLLGMAASSWVAGVCHVIAGNLDRAEQCARAGFEPAERLRDRTHTARVHFVAAWVAQVRGDLTVAREFCKLGLAAAPGEPRLLAMLTVVEAEAGNLDLANAYLGRLLETRAEVRAADVALAVVIAYTGAFLAFITRDAERLDIYAQAASPVLSSPDAPEYYRQMMRVTLGVIAVLRRDAAGAGEQYQELRASSGLFLLFWTVDHLLGLQARATGEAQATAVHFEDALAFRRKGGYRPELGWTCLDYAELLLEEGGGVSSVVPLSQPGEGQGEGETRAVADARAEAQVRAAALLGEGLQIAQELGLRTLMQRILAHRPILKA